MQQSSWMTPPSQRPSTRARRSGLFSHAPWEGLHSLTWIPWGIRKRARVFWVANVKWTLGRSCSVHWLACLFCNYFVCKRVQHKDFCKIKFISCTHDRNIQWTTVKKQQQLMHFYHCNMIIFIIGLLTNAFDVCSANMNAPNTPIAQRNVYRMHNYVSINDIWLYLTCCCQHLQDNNIL